MTAIRFWNANAEAYETYEGKCIRSGNGYSADVEYGVLYKLADGRYLGGVRHHDRGDLMTDIKFARTARGAMPARWR